MATKTLIAQHSLWNILHQLSSLISRCEEAEFAKTEITGPQFSVLMTMVYVSEFEKEPVTVTNLVPFLDRSLTSISSMVYRLEKLRLVEQVRDLADRRSVRLKITPKGEAILKSTSIINSKLIDRLFAIYSYEELQTLVALMGKLVDKTNQELLEGGAPAYMGILNPGKLRRLVEKYSRGKTVRS